MMDKTEIKKIIDDEIWDDLCEAFEDVVANMQDTNTEYAKTRELNVKMKFKQNEYRSDIQISVQVSTKLAPRMQEVRRMATNISGEFEIEEHGKGYQQTIGKE